MTWSPCTASPSRSGWPAGTGSATCSTVRPGRSSTHGWRSYRDCYDGLRTAVAERDRLHAEAQERAREIDVLRFGLEEIGRADPQPGEDVALAAEAQRLQASGDLRVDANAAIEAIAGSDDEAGGALSALAVARQATDRLAEADPGAKELSDQVREVGYLLNELTGDLSRYLDGLEAQPGRLEQIAERRFELAGLLRSTV